MSLIVHSAHGSVASWRLEGEQNRHPIARVALDTLVGLLADVAAILEAHRLLVPREVVFTRKSPTARVPPRKPLASTNTLIPGCQELLDDLEREDRLREVGDIMIVGTGTIFDQDGRSSEALDVAWLDAWIFRHPIIHIRTQSDAWLPFDLHGNPQPETAARNAPRLAQALRAIKATVPLTFSFDELSDFALNDGFKLRNREALDGSPLDVIDDPKVVRETR